MTPLAISAYTLTTALGAGARADAGRAAGRSAAASQPVRFLDVDAADLDRRGRRRSTTMRAAGRASPTSTAATTGWPGSALQQDGFVERCRGARALGRAAGRRCSSAPARRGCCRPNSPTAGAGRTARCRPTSTTRPTQNTYSVAAFVAARARPARAGWVVSTACSSSAKVFGNAARMIAAGLVDAAVVGGVDSLCLTTLYGFNSLELLSTEICRPWDAQRDGLSIGEAAAFALLERDDDAPPQGWLLGVGESSDGYHMSTPHPEGAGAIAAMRAALARCRARRPATSTTSTCTAPRRRATTPPRIARSAASSAHATPCSSTKGATGHTLGAAGGVEAAICAARAAPRTAAGGPATCSSPTRRSRLNYLRRNRARAAARGCSATRSASAAPTRSLVLGSGGMSDARHAGAAWQLASWIDGIGLLGAGPGVLAERRGGAARRGRVRAGRRGAAAAAAPAAGRTPPRRRRRSASRWRSPTRRSRTPASTRGTLATVFASSGGEGDNCHVLCEALARRRPPWSRRPASQFGAQRRRPATGTSRSAAAAASTSLCAYDASFAAGLLEAVTERRRDRRRPVLLVACDVALPGAAAPRCGRCPATFGVALRAGAGRRARARAASTIGLAGCDAGRPITPAPTPALDALRRAMPAARRAAAAARRSRAGDRASASCSTTCRRSRCSVDPSPA